MPLAAAPSTGASRSTDKAEPMPEPLLESVGGKEVL